ncbi:MAG TPA: Clp protease N-terminal domain-containing protein, partial [Caldisericia bacterium]|nr:Clp protease N-terminal domain-containing protein [Caldisericia bacterium]
MKFERYTDALKDVMSDAQQVLERYHDIELDNEHLLIALLEKEDSVVREILSNLGKGWKDILQEVEKMLASHPHPAQATTRSQIYITPRAKSTLERAEEEANSLGDEFVGPEHLFMALSQDTREIGRIMTQRGLDREAILQGLAKIRGGEGEGSGQAKTALDKFTRDLT